MNQRAEDWQSPAVFDLAQGLQRFRSPLTANWPAQLSHLLAAHLRHTKLRLDRE